MRMDPENSNSDFEHIYISEALEKLSSDAELGLSHSEAHKRLEKYGENIVEEKARNPVLRFLFNFWALFHG